MIARIVGKLVEKRNQSIIVNVQGLCYEVIVPVSVLERIEETQNADGDVSLVTYHYFQMTPSSATPFLVGFINEIERDFFLQFITVSGIGPRAAVKALNKPISEIAKAIDQADLKYLQTLPGIGGQRAKEVIAKLQGKVGKFGLIKDRVLEPKTIKELVPDWQEEALNVLLQLQYKKQEALDMMNKVLERSKSISTTEELLNEIYRNKVKTS